MKPTDIGFRKDKRSLAVLFYYMQFLDENEESPSRYQKKDISVLSYDKGSMIDVPPGQILEYHIELLKNPVLKFGLSTNMPFKSNSQLHIAIYNNKGKKISRIFERDQINRHDEIELKLESFTDESVKMVFANSISNDPEFRVFLTNPVVSFSAGKDFPLFLHAKKNLSAKKTKKGLRSKKPNVFIYLIDTLRADHLSCYGYEKNTTPFIDKFSKDGILFRNFFANASWTKPSVGSILTGLYPHKHRAETEEEKLSSDVNTISEILKLNGFYTIYLTSNANISEEFNFNQGNDYYELSSVWENSSETLNSVFFSFIEQNSAILEEPIFAYIHTIDPHDPYIPQEPFLKFLRKDIEKKDLAYGDDILRKSTYEGLSEEDLEFIISQYDCEIYQNDFHFNKFIEFLKEKKLYDNSIIILVSDHGEQFCEHGRLFHGSSIYNKEIHIPLIIKFPHNEFSGTQSDIFLNQVDLMPTLLNYLEYDIPSQIDGMDILSLLKKKNVKRSIFIKEKKDDYNFIGFITNTDKMKYIAECKENYLSKVISYETYDLEKDFFENNNLLLDSTPFQITTIKFRVDFLFQQAGESIFKKESNVDVEKLNPTIIEALKALGYLK
ncbi:sulfatase [Acidobacteriota bacterium]